MPALLLPFAKMSMKFGAKRVQKPEQKAKKAEVANTGIDLARGPVDVVLAPLPGQGICASFGSKQLIFGQSIGSGGFGTVRLAGEQEGNRVKLSAVKCLDLGKDFARHEVKMLQKAESPLRPSHFLVNSSGRQAFIVMPLALGTLNDLMSLFPAGVSEERSCLASATLPLFSAVRALHERGISHRDIKPANVLVTQDFRLILGDFGIATTDIKSRKPAGTLDFIAPEALNLMMQPPSLITLVHDLGTSYNTQLADWYSMGLTALKALTGKNPVDFEDFGRSVYGNGCEAIKAMHVELGLAEPRIDTWLQGNPLSVGTGVFKFSPSRRQLQTFLKQLRDVDTNHPVLRAAMGAIKFSPEARLQGLGALPPESASYMPADMALFAKDYMVTPARLAVMDCPLLGAQARQEVISGQRKLSETP